VNRSESSHERNGFPLVAGSCSKCDLFSFFGEPPPFFFSPPPPPANDLVMSDPEVLPFLPWMSLFPSTNPSPPVPERLADEHKRRMAVFWKHSWASLPPFLGGTHPKSGHPFSRRKFLFSQRTAAYLRSTNSSLPPFASIRNSAAPRSTQHSSSPPLCQSAFPPFPFLFGRNG